MNRVVNICEKSVRAIPTSPVVLAAGVKKDILPDQTEFPGVELMGRYIQNVGGNPVYYNIGADCDNATNYCGILSPLQQLDCSNHCMRISGYSVAGSTIAITLLKRADLMAHSNFIGGAAQAV